MGDHPSGSAMGKEEQGRGRGLGGKGGWYLSLGRGFFKEVIEGD